MEEKKYYSAKEAQEILGMTYSALRNQVITGNVRKVFPPGKRQAQYVREDVDKLKNELDAFFISKAHVESGPAKFVKATIEDMPEAVALADAVFGGHNTIPIEKRVEWLKKNPDIDFLVKQEGQLIGYASLVPWAPATIDDLLTQKRFAKDLTADDILTYTPGVPIDIYGMAIGVLPGFNRPKKREVGMILLLGIKDFLIELGHRKVIIRSIKAHSTKPDGIKLMKHAGFTEVESSIKGMHDFIVDVETSGISFIMKYKEALRTVKNTQVAQIAQQ